jgi:hypothetical protein
MVTRLTALSVGVIALLTCVGCTHTQLRKNTVRQAQTVADIYQQQVMDNLAKFAYDYDSLPHFSTASAGTSQVTDAGSIAYAVEWMGGAPGTHGLSPSASRAAQETWTLVPISDPRKLELMRCAYQTAIAPCAGRAVPTDCPRCQALFNRFYTGDPEKPVPQPNISGVITSECIGPGYCWLGIGPKECVPKDCGCNFVGCYCGVYVWVLPGCQNELTKLTIAILDYAIKEPVSTPVKTVVAYIDASGNPTTSSKAVAEVTAVMSVDKHSLSAVQPDIATSKPKMIKRIEAAQKKIDKLEAALAGQLPMDTKIGDLRPLLSRPLADLSQKESERLDKIIGNESALMRDTSELRMRLQEKRRLEETLETLEGAIPPESIGPERLPDRQNSPVPGFGGSILLLEQQLQTLAPPNVGR